MMVRFENEKIRRPLWLRRILQVLSLCSAGGLGLSFPEEMPLFHDWRYIFRHYFYPLPLQTFTQTMVASQPFGDLLHWVPLPRAYRLSRQTAVASLGDHLAQALADPTYNEGKDSFYHLIPLLFAAILIAARGEDFCAAYVNYYYDGGRDLLRNTLHRAAGWLARELPGRQLDPRVEAEITRMLSDRIGLYHRRQLLSTMTT
jgi:hypothetical protein